jgi:hypothetical protein
VRHLAFVGRTSLMSDQTSELVEILKLNGELKKNYGKLLGAYLCLRSVSAVRGRSFFLSALVMAVFSIAMTWVERGGLTWLHNLRLI